MFESDNSVESDPYIIFVSDDPTGDYHFYSNYVSNVGLCGALS